MLSLAATVLSLLPKLPTALAATKEVADLVAHAKQAAAPHVGDDLDKALELARKGSDAAHAELQALVKKHTT